MRWLPVSDRGSPRPQRHLWPPTAMTVVLSFRAWPIHQERIGTSWAVSHTGHNIYSILGSNETPLGCLYHALVYRYHFVWRRHENMSPSNTNYKQMASWDECQFRTEEPQNLKDTLRFGQRANHSAIPRDICLPRWFNICLCRQPSAKKGMALANRYHIPVTTASRFRVVTIIHWAVYTTHRHIP